MTVCTTTAFYPIVLSSLASLSRRRLEKFFDTCNETLCLRYPGTDLLFFKAHKIVIIALLPALKEIAIEQAQFCSNGSSPNKVTIQQTTYARVSGRGQIVLEQ